MYVDQKKSLMHRHCKGCWLLRRFNTSKEVCNPSVMREYFLLPVHSGNCGIKLFQYQKRFCDHMYVDQKKSLRHRHCKGCWLLRRFNTSKEVCSPSVMRGRFPSSCRLRQLRNKTVPIPEESYVIICMSTRRSH
ncbi:hypothetical protein TNCV_4729031 [Trichonephila clavipes]|nr:hypothetical protein TNCV_4729031 [Trichonephila clavipes]